MSPSAGYHARRVVIAVLTLAVVLLTTALPSSASGTQATAGRGSASFWHPLSGKPASAGRKVDIKATSYRAFSLDRGAMKIRLAEAPSDKGRAAEAPLILSLPAPGGGFERFAVQESPVVAPALAAKFPFITTYAGQGIDDPSATARLDLGRTGFHAQVLSEAGDWYIDPIFRLDQSAYASYFKESLVNTHGPSSSAVRRAAEATAEARRRPPGWSARSSARTGSRSPPTASTRRSTAAPSPSCTTRWSPR